MSFLERQKDIEHILLGSRKVLVDDLSKRFGVSEVTIRKDLTQLENRGILLRTHGGAVLAEKPELVINQHKRSQEQVLEKNFIAQTAAQRVKDGESILLDTGSTTLALVRELRGRNITVVTNSILIAMELVNDDRITVIVLGGTLRHSSLALMGAMALEPLRNLHVDRAFMGASGFDPKNGFSCQNLIEAETKKAMLKTAAEVVVLVDHTKFGKTAFAPFCTLKETHVVVTNAPPPKPTADLFKRSGISVVVTHQALAARPS